jgi:UDP-N-acetyl-D-mannosaminuronate dehydrogenase
MTGTIQVLGLAYKPNVDDEHESRPTIESWNCSGSEKPRRLNFSVKKCPERTLFHVNEIRPDQEIHVGWAILIVVIGNRATTGRTSLSSRGGLVPKTDLRPAN